MNCKDPGDWVTTGKYNWEIIRKLASLSDFLFELVTNLSANNVAFIFELFSNQSQVIIYKCFRQKKIWIKQIKTIKLIWIIEWQGG